MTKLTHLRRQAHLPLLIALSAIGSLVGGCGGRGNGLSGQEFLYLATGTNVVQFNIASSTGILTELIPNTAPSTNAVAIATTNDSRFAYAVNKSAATVSQYQINGDGTLTALNPATAGTGTAPVAVAVTPAHAFLYVLNHGDNTIGEYAVAGNGTLSPLNPATVGVAADGDSLVITPNGSYLYATSYSTGLVSGYSIGVNGQLTALGTTAVAQPQGPAVSPNGAYLYVPSSTLGVAEFSIGADGSLTALAPADVSTGGAGNDTAAVTPNGAFAYVGVFNGGFPGSPVAQFSVGAGGVLSALAPPTAAAGNAPYNVIVEQSGKYAYVANQNDGTVSLFSIGADGTLTALATPTINPNGALQMALAKR